MSLRVSIIFTPNCALLPEQATALINSKIPSTAKLDEYNYIVISGQWPGNLSPCYDSCFYWDYEHWCFDMQCYWNDVLKNLDFRLYIMTLCEALGAEEWWYIEETSIDLFDEMPMDEFNRILSHAPRIDQFEQPLYFPHSQHHFFRDSAWQIESQLS